MEAEYVSEQFNPFLRGYFVHVVIDSASILFVHYNCTGRYLFVKRLKGRGITSNI